MNRLFAYAGKDIPAGLVVFLVALPLCLGISLASGAPFFSGIISGVIGGIVIGIFSNSNLSVSGPAAGLASLVLGAITAIGDYRLFLCAVVLAGLIQIALSLLKLGGIANYIPGSVIKGMLTSIGILIIAKQIPKGLGIDVIYAGKDILSHIHFTAIFICLFSIGIIALWEKPFIKKRFGMIPGALVAVFTSVILNWFIGTLSSSYALDGNRLVNLPTASSMSEFFQLFTLPDWSGFTDSKVITYGLFIALIASLETLLSIEAIDNLDPEKRITDSNRELLAQGIGNSIAGLIGGLPVTSVIVRSTANLNTGARSKLSTIFHGILLLVCVALIPTVLNKIPLASLAAILIYTGYKLAKPQTFLSMFKNGKYQFIPFIITVASIIALDLIGAIDLLKGKGLIIGVIAGIVSAVIGILKGNLKNPYFFHKEKHHHGDAVLIKLSEEVSFLNKASIRQTLDHMPESTRVIIDASNTKYIDFDILELIKEFRDIKAPLKNITCHLLGFRNEYKIENNLKVQSIH